MAPTDALPRPDSAEVIVVVGTALSDPQSDRLLDVVVIDRRALTDAPSRRLETILEQAGVRTFRRSDSSSSHPTSQGITLRGLGGNAANRALLVLDGIPQNDPFGGWTNWPAYDPAGLANVKVTRGGGSVAAGPGALAGIIEASSSMTLGIAGLAEVGSRQSLDGSLQLGASVGSSLMSLGLQGSRGDGFIPIAQEWRGPADRRAPFKQGNARLRWIIPLPGAELQASLSAFRDERDRGVDFTANRTRGEDASLRLVGRGKWAWSALAYGQWRNFRSSFASLDAGRTTAQRVSLQDNVPSSALGGAVELRPPIGGLAELRLGVDGRRMKGHSHEFSNYVAGEPTRDRDSGGKASHAGAFAEFSHASRPWGFSLAGRVDHWQIRDGRLDEQSLVTGLPITAVRYGSRDGWLPTGRAAAGLAVSPGLSLRAAAYLGWRMPTLNELFRPFRAGRDATAANPELDPERLAGAEVGLNWQPSANLDVAATVFVNRLKDGIANVTLGQGPGIFPGVGFVAGDFRQRRNLDQLRVRGADASLSWRRGPWRLSANYYYADARIRASGVAAPLDGFRPAQTPRHSATAQLGMLGDRVYVMAQIDYSGPQYEDDLNRLEMPGAVTVGGFASWRVGDRLNLIVRGDNLLNKRVVATIGSDGTIERATPRTLWIGLRLDPPGLQTSGGR